jgi:hypothetical protein
MNTRFRASPSEPLCIYAKDFNQDGRIDPVLCYYIQGKNYVYPTRDELIRQIAGIRVRFPTYKDYASVSFEGTFTSQELNDAKIVQSECFQSSYLENLGGGKFLRKSLPIQCQFAPVFGMVTCDYNQDGHLDLVVTGNSYSTEVSTGNYDAMSGLLLIGDGKGNFKPENAMQTGFKADHDAKGIGLIHLENNMAALIVGNNNEKLEAYQFSEKGLRLLQINQDDEYAIVHKRDGNSYKQEFYFGSTYLSSSSRMLCLAAQVDSVSIFDYKKNERIIKIRSKDATR